MISHVNHIVLGCCTESHARDSVVISDGNDDNDDNDGNDDNYDNEDNYDNGNIEDNEDSEGNEDNDENMMTITTRPWHFRH